MTWVIVLVVVIGAMVAVGLAVSIVELQRAEQQMSGDWCRECMVDLPRGQTSGLVQALFILQGVRAAGRPRGRRRRPGWHLPGADVLPQARPGRRPPTLNGR